MSDIRARDVMTRDVKTVNNEVTLDKVAECLINNGISGVPVVDKNGKMVGIISEADLINEDKRTAAIPKLGLFGLWVVPDDLLQESYKEGFSLSVKELMTKHVITAAEDATLDELTDLMISHKINRIPIVSEDKLVGIVTREDVLKGLLRENV